MLQLRVSGSIITESHKLPENLYLKVFSGMNLEKAIELRFYCLFFGDNGLPNYLRCVSFYAFWNSLFENRIGVK